MYTFCPECETVFQVKADHLQVANGWVRCGECRHRFNAVDCLFEELAAARNARKEYEGLNATPEADLVDDSDEWQGPAAASPLQQSVLAEGWDHRSVTWRDVISGAGIGFLVLLFGIQWLYFNRVELAGDISWRQTMEQFCSILRCELPPRTELSRIDLLDRDVRKHPQVEDALLINATLINHADFRQPYPVFSISFSDLSGKPVAVRRFNPAEYLPDGVNIKAGLAAGFPVPVVLEIQDPGDEGVSFQFEFL